VAAALTFASVAGAACSSDDGNSAAADAASSVEATVVEATVVDTTGAPATTVGAPTTTVAPVAAVVVAPASGASTIADLLALDRPVVLAHAGGEDEFPHSTPFAFASSAAAGVDMLDLDVQLSADGVLIVHHDDTIDRTTESTGTVATMTYDQLALLDNAYWFTALCVCQDQPPPAYLYRGIRTGDVPPPPGATADDFVIPRFVDIIERFPSYPLNIEIKGSGAPAIAAADALVAILTQYGRLDGAVVTSFDDTVVAHLSTIAPTLELTPGLDLSTKWVLERTPLPAGMRILQVPIEYSGIQVITPELVADSHAAGYLIWVWPNDRDVENADGYASLLAQGLDGLNINYPATGVAAVQAFIANG
jgi:glycerophosphoryl diester phosphodiesterase